MSKSMPSLVKIQEQVSHVLFLRSCSGACGTAGSHGYMRGAVCMRVSYGASSPVRVYLPFLRRDLFSS